MQVTLAETENGNKALRFIGEVLEASKEDLTKAVSSEILDKEKRATAAAEAREKLRVDEESAYAEFLKALAELDAVGLSDAAIANPPNNATAAQKVKIFEAQRTLRLWCAKLNALKNIGETPSGTRRSCP